MIEYLRKRLNKKCYEDEIKDFLLFKWEIESTKETNKGVLVTFKRDTEMPNYQKLIELEENYFALRTPNYLSVYILMIVSFIFFTIFIIDKFVVGTDLLISFLTSLLPGIIVFIIGSILFFVKTHKINKLIKDGETIKKDILRKLKQL